MSWIDAPSYPRSQMTRAAVTRIARWWSLGSSEPFRASRPGRRADICALSKPGSPGFPTWMYDLPNGRWYHGRARGVKPRLTAAVMDSSRDEFGAELVVR